MKLKLSDKLEYKLVNLPSSPGVYLYKNKKDEIIYIGKAKNLKNRIKSYFTNFGKHQQFKTEILVSKIDNVEYILTDTELEALVLESSLIKKHKPKYNIDLKDDKSYPYLKVTRELFPKITITRKILNDGAKYHGPYSNVKSLRRILKDLKAFFKIRNCNLAIDESSIKSKKHKVCLNYHIRICSGPCEGFTKPVVYQKNVKKITSFLTGSGQALISELKEKMVEASQDLRFEEAGELRDQIKLLSSYQSDQKVESGNFTPIDYLNIACEDNDACCVIFRVRNGRMVARNHFFLKGVFKKSSEEIAEEFIKKYYFQNTHDIPREIIVSALPEDTKTITEWLSGLRGKKAELIIPKIGNKQKLLKLAYKNAELLLKEMKQQKMEKDYTPRSLLSLKRDLNLPKLPAIIECFDISHFAGRETVASLICFKNAKPYKKRYRRYKIKTVEGIDDFASMKEVVERRYSRLKIEQNEEEPLPNLIIIDGGKGQLSSAVKILNNLELSNIPVVGLAKRMEEVFLPGDPEPIMIPRTSSALKLIKQIRDEAHRFAITFHRNLRGKSQIESKLDSIKGIGKRKKEALLKKFGSLKRVTEASLSELLEIKGITEKIANELKKL